MFQYSTSTAYVSLGNLSESKHLSGDKNYAAWSFLLKATVDRGETGLLG